jgi:hypothetical protein
MKTNNLTNATDPPAISSQSESGSATAPCVAAEQDITPEELRALPRFKGLTDEQANELIATVKTFTQVVFYANTTGWQTGIENGSGAWKKQKNKKAA